MRDPHSAPFVSPSPLSLRVDNENRVHRWLNKKEGGERGRSIAVPLSFIIGSINTYSAKVNDRSRARAHEISLPIFVNTRSSPMAKNEKN